MSVDVFGRQLSNIISAVRASTRGPPGEGFKTMKQKRIDEEEVQAHLINHSKTIKHLSDELTTLRESVSREIQSILDGLQSMITEQLKRIQEETNQDLALRKSEIIGDLDKRLIALENGQKSVIDIFSKYAWAVPTKTKNAKDVTNAMKSVLKQGRKPQKLHVDRGKEFYNNEFKKLMEDNGITMYSTFSNLKVSIPERFNRTLKEKMWKQFSLPGTYKWIPIVKTLVQSYNNTKHRAIHMKPIDVSADHEKYLLRHVYGKFHVNRTKKVKFKVGERVRISKYKNIFEKGYTPNWTTEIFTIDEVVNTDPVTYKLRDYEGKPIEGGFYQEELTKVKYPDVYLVEKILRRRGNQIFVKWLGFDNSHNSWINKNDL
ncbi:uncharacterized protein LOC107045463 [Diachasma alloeum]|uniref:uncharacterized protein LOC107045463 n=1 Tax=Diachasma alloeum TaxID=454923 RepID=UPI0007383005|nr:uncharacterized protein LOC107045463 [Diachasma alloeum]